MMRCTTKSLTRTLGIWPSHAVNRSHGCRHQRRAGRQRRTPASGKSLPGFVYLLVHQYEPRFKIGLSVDPNARAEKLREARDIARDRSIQVQLPSARRASEIERMLHKALAGFRLQLSESSEAGWDGCTEWFRLSGLFHAINLLKAVPVDEQPGACAQLQDLEGHPYRDALAMELATRSQQRRQLATEYNLRQISLIVDVLTMLRPHVPMRLGKAEDLPGSPVCLLLHNFKQVTQPWLLKLRFEVGDACLWALRTGKGAGDLQAQSLVRLIRYSPTREDAMELVLNEDRAVRSVPGGIRVHVVWRELLRRLVEGECEPVDAEANGGREAKAEGAGDDDAIS